MPSSFGPPLFAFTMEPELSKVLCVISRLSRGKEQGWFYYVSRAERILHNCGINWPVEYPAELSTKSNNPIDARVAFNAFRKKLLERPIHGQPHTAIKTNQNEKKKKK